jgi:hypothetical protein
MDLQVGARFFAKVLSLSGLWGQSLGRFSMELLGFRLAVLRPIFYKSLDYPGHT